MVRLSQVITSDQSLQSLPAGLVTVSVGVSHDFELATLRSLAKYQNAPKIYIFDLGQFPPHIGGSTDIISTLKSINPSGSYKTFDNPIGPLSEVDGLCEDIKMTEDHVDLLIMSSGFLQDIESKETEEGLRHGVAEHRFYMRQRFIVNLLPLLTKSLSPRIVSILPPDHDNIIKFQDPRVHHDKTSPDPIFPFHEASETALLFCAFAKRSPEMTFISVYPGLLPFGSFAKLVQGVAWYPGQVLKWAAPSRFQNMIGISVEEVAERMVFLATSVKYPPAKVLRKEGKKAGWADIPGGIDRIGVARAMIMVEGHGNGAYRINEKGDTCNDGETLDKHIAEFGEEALNRAMTKLSLYG